MGQAHIRLDQKEQFSSSGFDEWRCQYAVMTGLPISFFEIQLLARVILVVSAQSNISEPAQRAKT
jgi:hypothetical protein